MKLEEKIQKFKEQDLGLWLKTREQAEDTLSAQQPLFCICGRLATGFHEGGCRKFQREVDKLAVKKMEGKDG